jgi:3-polyprenyl-4-hydroxybenzoate decarboxylase
MMGAVILPPMLEYYSRPASVEECTEQIAGKLLDNFNINISEYKRWQGV